MNAYMYLIVFENQLFSSIFTDYISFFVHQHIALFGKCEGVFCQN